MQLNESESNNSKGKARARLRPVKIPLVFHEISCIVIGTDTRKVRHSTTAAYYSIIIVVHVIRLHLDRHYVSSPETFDNAFSYKR